MIDEIDGPAEAGSPELPQTFDVDGVAAELKLSAEDKNFALAILGGANQSQALMMAGSSLEGVKLRKKASRLAGTKRIKEFLRLARLAGKDEAMPVLDRETRRRLLSRDANGHDTQARQRAIDLLNKMDNEDRQAREAGYSLEPAPDPRQTLDEIAALSPECAIIAKHLAARNGLDWTPPTEIETGERR